MSLKSLQDTLLSHVDGKKPVSVESLQSHFADLVLNPAHTDPKIPFELSDALRGCMVENEAINRVYETIDRVLSLQNTPEGIWKEMRQLKKTYANSGGTFRLAKVADGTTLNACFRVVTYLRAQGVIADVEGFLRNTEEAFRDTGGKVGSHNEFVFLAADLYTDLLVF